MTNINNLIEQQRHQELEKFEEEYVWLKEEYSRVRATMNNMITISMNNLINSTIPFILVGVLLIVAIFAIDFSSIVSHSNQIIKWSMIGGLGAFIIVFLTSAHIIYLKWSLIEKTLESMYLLDNISLQEVIDKTELSIIESRGVLLETYRNWLQHWEQIGKIIIMTPVSDSVFELTFKFGWVKILLLMIQREKVK